MDTATVLELVYALFIVATKIAAPILLASMCVGLLSGLLQAVTQVSDSTLGFLPKLVTVGIVFWLCLPWIIQSMLTFVASTFHAMERAAR